jgi:hypothetical protein
MLQPASESPARVESAEDPHFSERALTALRSAMQGHLRETVSDDALRRALQPLCIDARRRAVRPEKLILALKNVWGALPELQERNAIRRPELLDRIVTICIEEYYAH